MSDIFPLRPTPRPLAPDERVVSLLRDLLAEAQAGRIRTCAVATLCVLTTDPALRPVLHWVDEAAHAMALSSAAAKMAREIAEG